MNRDKKRILIVDDSVVVQRLVQARLRADGFDVCASRGENLLGVAHEYQPDVILLDVELKAMNGLDACKMLKEDATTKGIPVIFLTGQSKTEDKVKGLDLGAVDYVLKPFDPVELRARVRSAYRTKYLMELLEQKAQIDGLTGLYNRTFFDQRIRQELDRAGRYSSPLALIFMDIDRFKSLNDTYGHSFGDVVLSEVADSLRSIARASDVIARYGGEEFVIILPEQDLASGIAMAERARSNIESLGVSHNGEVVPLSASFGVSSTVEIGAGDVARLIDTADRGLYRAKESGRNRVCAINCEESLIGLNL